MKRLRQCSSEAAEKQNKDMDAELFDPLEVLVDFFFDHLLDRVTQDMDSHHVLEKTGADAALKTADFVFTKDVADFRMLFDNFLYAPVAYITLQFHCICSGCFCAPL
jgi:malonyl CoA-acyl carrier protein transacylase